jgi:hypothetical protein
MDGSIFQVPIAGGFEGKLPQTPQNGGKVVNWTLDKATGAWSSRIGYEKWNPKASDLFSPFGSIGPITSLFVSQGLAGGARQSIFFEADGTLYLAYDAGAAGTLLRTVKTNRHIPTPTECGSWYTDVAGGVVITNGVDRPLFVRPWPLGDAAESPSSLLQCVRSFGFDASPPPVEPHRNTPMAVVDDSSVITGGGATTLWWPSQSGAITDGGKWGLGFAKGPASGDPENESLFGWSVSYVSDTGSEGPLSTMATTNWTQPAKSDGFRHCIALDVPTGPDGTVGRRLYRTLNFSDDWTQPGDTTMYFVGALYNNVDTFFVDCVRTTVVSTKAAAIPTGPLPAPRARFSALFNGCLWFDGGIDDSRTLYYSVPGLIEQFPIANYLTLSGQGGGITAIFGNYTSLLVFRESAIDVVTGDAINGFQATTISNSTTCRSPKSIRSIPGLGVVFLAQDGVYAITGGLTGGATTEIIGLSGGIDEFIRRMTPDCLPRAVSAYSTMTGEYHLYAPMDGNDRPTSALVLHTARLGDTLSAWSVREGFPVGDIDVLYDGVPVFGHNTGTEAGGSNPEAGLFIISSLRHMGGTVTGDQQPAYTLGAAPQSIYRSAWNDLGDPRLQKQVNYVVIWVLTTGNPAVIVRHFKDFQLNYATERTFKAQPPDAALLPVFDTAILNDGATYQQERLVPLRVSIAQQSCAWFAFEVATTEDLIFVGYEIEYVSKGTKTIMGVRA